MLPLDACRWSPGKRTVANFRDEQRPSGRSAIIPSMEGRDLVHLLSGNSDCSARRSRRRNFPIAGEGKERAYGSKALVSTSDRSDVGDDLSSGMTNRAGPGGIPWTRQGKATRTPAASAEFSRTA